MNMNIRKTFLATSAIALGLLVQPVLSQAFDGEQGQRWHQCRDKASGDARKMRGWERLADRLALTQEQRQAMSAIKDKYQPTLLSLRQQLSDSRAALEKLSATDAGLPELAATQGKAISDMIIARKQMRSEMDKVLTEEQRQKMNGLMEHHRHTHHRDTVMDKG